MAGQPTLFACASERKGMFHNEPDRNRKALTSFQKRDSIPVQDDPHLHGGGCFIFPYATSIHLPSRSLFSPPFLFFFSLQIFGQKRGSLFIGPTLTRGEGRGGRENSIDRRLIFSIDRYRWRIRSLIGEVNGVEREKGRGRPIGLTGADNDRAASRG